MPTNYNIHLMHVHPRSMTFNPPKAEEILEKINDLLGTTWGMIPVAAEVARADNQTTFTEYEGKAWVHNAPDDLLMGVANMIDGFYSQLIDRDSPIFNEAIANEDSRDIGSRIILEMLLEHRREVKST